MLLYNSALDESFFVDEFIEGLKPELRSAVHLHLPGDFDTASLLALLQEEEMESVVKTQGDKNSKSVSRFDRYSKDRSGHKTEEHKKKDSGKWEDKLDSLKAYRRSKGLCLVCGEKYSKIHKCPEQIPLHVIEELMDVLPGSTVFGKDNNDSESEPDDLMLIAAVTAPTVSTASSKTKCTIRLPGTVGKHHLLILVDSGSASSFISEKMVATLQCATTKMSPVQFTVANGAPMHCTSYLPDFEWAVQGHTF